MYEDICEKIVWTKFGGPPEGEVNPQKSPFQNETFELWNIEN